MTGTPWRWAGWFRRSRNSPTRACRSGGDLPLIGPAFRNRSNQRTRTELIVFIRPKVIRGTVEADRIAEDFHQQFKAMMPVRPVPPPTLAAPVPGPKRVLRRMID